MFEKGDRVAVKPPTPRWGETGTVVLTDNRTVAVVLDRNPKKIETFMPGELQLVQRQERAA